MIFENKACVFVLLHLPGPPVGEEGGEGLGSGRLLLSPPSLTPPPFEEEEKGEEGRTLAVLLLLSGRRK